MSIYVQCWLKTWLGAKFYIWGSWTSASLSVITNLMMAAVNFLLWDKILMSHYQIISLRRCILYSYTTCRTNFINKDNNLNWEFQTRILCYTLGPPYILTDQSYWRPELPAQLQHQMILAAPHHWRKPFQVTSKMHMFSAFGGIR